MLVEIQQAVISNEVTWIERKDNVTTEMSYGEYFGPHPIGGDVAYECSVCFELIATNERELYDWLVKNNMLEDVDGC